MVNLIWLIAVDVNYCNVISQDIFFFFFFPGPLAELGDISTRPTSSVETRFSRHKRKQKNAIETPLSVWIQVYFMRGGGGDFLSCNLFHRPDLISDTIIFAVKFGRILLSHCQKNNQVELRTYSTVYLRNVQLFRIFVFG